MKKIMILIAGILFSAGSIFAIGVNTTGTASVDSNGNGTLMVEIDSLMEEVKEGCICTMEYAPICGKQDEDLVTFGNQCELDCANKNNGKVKFLYRGVCKELKKPGACDCNPDVKNISCVDTEKGNFITSKSDCDWKCTSSYGPRKVLYKGECKEEVKYLEKIPNNNGSYNTGITGGIKGINNKVPMPKELDPTKLDVKFDDAWVKVDENFSFNTKTKEWKDDQGICHTCTEENGFTKKGSIVIDGKTIAGAVYGNGKNKINIEVDSMGDDFVILGNGIRVKTDSNGEKEDKKISLEFKGEDIKIDGDLKLEIKDEAVFLQGKEISIPVEDAKEKAKRAASADMILDFRFSGDEDNINYIITTQKETKFLGLFYFNMESEVKIDIETGAVVEVNEPWYSFLLF